jgi:hypothetical protein
VLERIAMTLAGAGTLKLGKRRASSTQADPWPTKKNCAVHVVGKLDDDCEGSGSATEDDSEAEREEVQECLLRPATPSPAAQQQHRAIFTAFSTVPRALPQSRSCSQSPSAHPCHQLPHTTPATANANAKVSLRLFMGGVEVPMKPPQRASRKTQPHHRAQAYICAHPQAMMWPQQMLMHIDEQSGVWAGP